MRNSLRCCLACVLPCGALDMIRIVHLNGNVEELMRPVTAGEILEANPNHVLSKPCSQGVVRKIMILSPDSELKRGSIYFLIPSSSLPKNKSATISSNKKPLLNKRCSITTSSTSTTKKKSSGRPDHSVGVWRPHLESISED
ncbi:uncharacterized protein [Rutidosis leptorrhynchoides]|uniref:uncharacterized protein n=1 Tax=Rutidosis leptorrhynchoides TaxID=125765 RepID=UPI003A99A091